MPIRLLPRFLLLSIVLSLLTHPALAQWTAPNPITRVQKQADGILLHLKTGTLRFQVCSPAIVHLTYSPSDQFPTTTNPAIIKSDWPQTQWEVQEAAGAVTLSTAALKIAVDRKTGSITYSDTSGHALLHDDSKTMTLVTVNGEKTYRAEDYMTLGGYLSLIHI